MQIITSQELLDKVIICVKYFTSSLLHRAMMMIMILTLFLCQFIQLNSKFVFCKIVFCILQLNILQAGPVLRKFNAQVIIWPHYLFVVLLRHDKWIKYLFLEFISLWKSRYYKSVYFSWRIAAGYRKKLYHFKATKYFFWRQDVFQPSASDFQWQFYNFLSHCVIATVEPFKNKIVDHTSTDQGMANNYQLKVKFDE